MLVIAGPNGAGESTIAPGLVGSVLGAAEFVNADRIARGLGSTEHTNVNFVAGRMLLERIRALVHEGRDLAFESTLASRSFAPFLAGARERGYRAVMAYVWPGSADVAVARVQQRQLLGGHGIPEVVVRRRFQRSVANFFELYLPLSDAWRFYFNRERTGPELLASGTLTGNPAVYDNLQWSRVLSEVERIND